MKRLVTGVVNRLTAGVPMSPYGRRRLKAKLRKRSYHMRKRGRIMQRREWR